MSKVLLIDDDTTLLDLLKQSLTNDGFEVLTAASGLKGVQAVYSRHPDLVVVDVMMPHMDGWQVCQRIREVSQTPIIMLTAKDEECDKLRGFALGIDDYVTKPFSFPELGARIRAILARSTRAQPDANDQVVTVGELTIDLKNRHVSKSGRPIDLTATEYKLLALLAVHARHVLSVEQLVRHVWGDAYVGETGYVKRYIWYLRQKIEDEPSRPQYLLNERGFGYSLGRNF